MLLGNMVVHIVERRTILGAFLVIHNQNAPLLKILFIRQNRKVKIMGKRAYKSIVLAEKYRGFMKIIQKRDY